jgi:hypothetical protein
MNPRSSHQCSLHVPEWSVDGGMFMFRANLQATDFAKVVIFSSPKNVKSCDRIDEEAWALLPRSPCHD